MPQIVYIEGRRGVRWRALWVFLILYVLSIFINCELYKHHCPWLFRSITCWVNLEALTFILPHESQVNRLSDYILIKVVLDSLCFSPFFFSVLIYNILCDTFGLHSSWGYFNIFCSFCTKDGTFNLMCESLWDVTDLIVRFVRLKKRKKKTSLVALDTSSHVVTA